MVAPNDKEGPVVYLNWLAAEHEPLICTHEYPIYSDAHVVAEATFGPYQFLHALPMPAPGVVQPTVILRYDWHWKFGYPDFSKTDSDQYHGGTPADELAALASLAVGVRFRAGETTREFTPEGDPKGHPRAWGTRPVPVLTINSALRRWVLPRVVEGAHSLELLEPLSILPKIDPSDATSLIRSARLYQDALWLSESEPALAWLLLVSALETAALHWRSQKEDPVVRFRTAKPELYEYLAKCEDSSLVGRVAEAFKESFGATRNFLDFVLTFLPDEPTERPEFGKIDWSNDSLERILKTVYDYRSKALHAGKPFPAPMCSPPFSDPGWKTHSHSEKPLGHISMSGGVWLEKDIPLLLHSFEYISREVLLKWWRSMNVRMPAGKVGVVPITGEKAIGPE